MAATAGMREITAAAAAVTIKEPKPDCRYLYWEWRHGEAWKKATSAPSPTRAPESSEHG